MTHARHVHPRPGRRARPRLALGAAGVAVLSVLAVATVVTRSPASTPECATASRPLRVVAAPEIAPVVAKVAAIGAPSGDGGSSGHGGSSSVDASCGRTVVVAADPATVAAELSQTATDRPDVWIPDSSTWTERPTTPGTGVPVDNPSVAHSPLVLAVPQAVARAAHHGSGPVTVADLVTRAAAGDTVPWAVGDPSRTSAGVGAVVELRAEVATRAHADALLTTVFQGARRDLTPGTAASLATVGSQQIAVPVAEQILYAHNAAHPADRLVAAYPTHERFSLDYPFVVLAADGARRAQAADLLAELHSGLGRNLLADAGFRTTSGAATGPLTTAWGITATEPGTAPTPAGPTVTEAVDAFRAVTLGSKLLVVIDVSGSMAYPVPGAPGATRLDLALEAAVNGLALYPDATKVALWTFSTGLTPTTDYKALVPYTSLGRSADGSTGRQRLAQALQRITVKAHGDTGLYDTVLAAVRSARRAWDPNRANSVVVITDGANDDPHGISLPTLLRTLRAENDPARPVRVYSIAYGPSGDLSALTAISKAVGGRAYPARDPRTIGAVLQDAIGRRA
ncbi:putative von Willebrand factor type A [Nostocoides japonicum T1-X7]|uniref:Putative von Willebrand factor type A n=1 Tax=Nostocoides japonicum T1-X7 TaxID=1194083 RepID=A0A077LY52_9MICO|nr:substrate-binding domain-containing protein [Tetrasphaera japonica]CCH78591.1 putative von Willebrand factor type A [Tetrasphaera japonica T1-X7]